MEIALRSVLMLQSSNLLKKGSLWKKEKQTEMLTQKDWLKGWQKDSLKDLRKGLVKLQMIA
jgi:hypothetical protein